ncbi:anthranilate synthase component 1 [Paraferrimonas haliotis]|uniref:anthranilate synthase component 1 n=1 Tax=Paraferrimonas haliotis TaxID=2013866 RepID=UPI003CC813D9
MLAMTNPHSINVTKLVQGVPYFADPLIQYRTLCQQSAHNMLLESAEIESKDHLKSLILVQAALKIRCDGHRLTFEGLTDNGQQLIPVLANAFATYVEARTNAQLIIELPRADESLDEDARLKSLSPLDGIRVLCDLLDLPQHQRDAIFVGGVLGYDLIDTVEPLPEVAAANNPCPDYLFYLAEVMLKIDHQQQSSELYGLAFGDAPQHTGTVHQRLAQVADSLEQLVATAPSPRPLTGVSEQAQASISDEAFNQCVVDLKQHIVAGDIFQVVPSRSFSLPCPNPLGAYQALRISNPSPYMFYLNSGEFSLFGASPESALKYDKQSNQVEIYPIAGTRIRGKDQNSAIDADLDSRIELELRLDQKELAEHLMLVDLARNDVARISAAGTRKVAELLKVDRYSHVMHLVSRVTGQLRDDLDALHAYQASMNMGTLVGAPKIRAAQLIREVEQARRGSYGGAVGYFNGQGDMDTCIVIRSAMVHQGVAQVQAGAGVVYDSDPQSESDETRNKAQAVISAIRQGGGL